MPTTKRYDRYARIDFIIEEKSRQPLTPERCNEMIASMRTDLINYCYEEFKEVEDVLTGKDKKTKMISARIIDLDEFTYWVTRPEKEVTCRWNIGRFDIVDSSGFQADNFNHFLPAKIIKDLQRKVHRKYNTVCRVTEVVFR